MTLEQFFHENPLCALAFSGGADSAYLLWAAVRSGAEVQPYFVKTPFQPQFELEDAHRLCTQMDVDLVVLHEDVLSDGAIAANPPDRCYHCKKRLFTRLKRYAASEGFSLLLDGTNASDDAGDRPGMRALRELEVRSPLRECGVTKDQVRRLSREAGLFTWDKPAYACLATRVPTGTAITPEALQNVENSEHILFEMGFSDFRIRLLGENALLQLPEPQMDLLLSRRAEILERLKPCFGKLYLDLEARHGQ